MSKGDADAEKGYRESYRETLKINGKLLKSDGSGKKDDEETIKGNGES